MLKSKRILQSWNTLTGTRVFEFPGSQHAFPWHEHPKCLISSLYQQRAHFVHSAPLPSQHQSIILFHFQLTELTGKKSELLQLPLLPGKGRRGGKIKIPGNCTAVRSSLSVASGRQPSVRGILPLPVGKHSTLKMHIFPWIARLLWVVLLSSSYCSIPKV